MIPIFGHDPEFVLRVETRLQELLSTGFQIAGTDHVAR
jgi:hypothetical protein